jgi:phospholipid/cholesterol/gamma-HCH transport system permease protein
LALPACGCPFFFLVGTESVAGAPATTRLNNAAAAPIQLVLFLMVVALTGCLRGMQCGSNAAAVGLATTSAVVTGIAWIIASDGVFAVICSALHL